MLSRYNQEIIFGFWDFKRNAKGLGQLRDRINDVKELELIFD